MPATTNLTGYRPEVSVWTDGRHGPVVGQLLDLMEQSVQPIALGGPFGGNTDAMADRFTAAHYDDLRQMVVERPAAYLLFAADEDPPPAVLATAIAAGTVVLTLEPACSSLAGYDELDRPARDGTPALPGRVVLLPRFTQMPGYLAATEPHDILGDRRSVWITDIGPAADRRLFARLHDAWTTTLCFNEVPELIHAALVSRGEPPADRPRDLAGRLTANAVCPGGSTTTLFVGDDTPSRPTELLIVGDEGQLAVSPTGYQLRDAEGGPIDGLEAGPVPPVLDQMATQWRRLLDQPVAPEEPGYRRDRQALACALACVLSAKTGQPESPQRVVQMSKG